MTRRDLFALTAAAAAVGVLAGLEWLRRRGERREIRHLTDAEISELPLVREYVNARLPFMVASTHDTALLAATE